ncbi:MAG: hypothetical protein IH987_14005 [Planctomycetes bacterium]|nr:hypothetical protein [Planctomycetota bacterium]
MIVYCFDDDRKFPLVASLTTTCRDIRLEIVTDATQRSLRIVTSGDESSDAEGAIVLALPLKGVDGAPEGIELEVTGDTRPLQVYIEGSDVAGQGLIWRLSGLERAGRHILRALADKPCDRWDQDDGDSRMAVAPPLTFHRLRLTVSHPHIVDIELHELRVTGNVHLVPSGLSDS